MVESGSPSLVHLRNHTLDSGVSPTTTIVMEEIEKALGSTVRKLSDQNYAKSFAFYHLRIDIGRAYHRISTDLIFDAIWKNRTTSSIVPKEGRIFHPTAHLILRLASDTESDPTLAPYSSGLQSRLSAKALQEFFTDDLRAAHSEPGSVDCLYAEANLVAHWANLGYVEEAAIRHHILQSLVSHEKLHDHQADALIILFKLAGATFEAYAEPSVVDHCLELLKGHSYGPAYHGWDDRYSDFRASYCKGAHPDKDNNDYFQLKKKLVQVCAPWAGSERRPPD